MGFQFSACQPHEWNGRYARIPGETTAFHVRMSSGRWWPFVDWTVGDEIAHCPLVPVPGAARLAEAVHDGKRRLGGRQGGSFLINEFGQVLVPSPFGDGRVVVVGQCSGPLIFEDRFSPGTTFDLTDVHGLNTGASWNRPYVGVPHNLSRWDEIYFWNQDQDGAWKLPPPTQDAALIRALRLLRASGPIRFVVGCAGLVLTKVPKWQHGNTDWQARYVGQLDYSRWYARED